MRTLDDYGSIVGYPVISEIREKARKLQGSRILHLNSTNQGGGVAEMLRSLVPLMNDVGLQADWRVIHGSPDFFTVTKKFHNGLQGRPFNLSEMKKRLYVETNHIFSSYCHVNADCVIVHDPQPLPLIEFYDKRAPWIWRCHVDLSHPDAELWEFLKTYISKYDLAIISSEAYRKADLPVQQRVVFPAIDPLSVKNRQLTRKDILKLIAKAGILTDKPIVTQVSRMDIWKDPEGLLDVFKRVRKEVDCRLIYCYDMALDDPEGSMVLQRVRKKGRKLIEDGDVLLVQGDNQVLVNAIQRVSDVLVQKSLKEGFCLCVTEALWKGKPVVGTRVGGIPQQLVEAENGFLVNPYDKEGFAGRIIELLRDRELSDRMGKAGRETVRESFLITRLLLDYLDMMEGLLDSRGATCVTCGQPLSIAA